MTKTRFKMLVESTGLKKEHIVKTSGVSRNKFYFALKAPAVLNETDIGKIAAAIRMPKEIVQAVVESDCPERQGRKTKSDK